MLSTRSCPTLCDPTDCSPPETTGFSRQEHFRGLPCPPPGDLPNPGIQPRPPALQADSLPSEPPGKLMNTGVGSLLFPGDIPNQEIEPGSPASQADSLPTESPGKLHLLSLVGSITDLTYPKQNSKFLLLFYPLFLSPSSPSHLTHTCFHL